MAQQLLPFSPQQTETFIAVYAQTRHIGKAAAAAAVSRSRADGLLNRPEVRDRIVALTGATLGTYGATPERVMQELSRIAFQDIRDIYDERGNLLPIHEMNDDAAAAISSIEVETSMQYSDDSPTERKPVSTVKVRRYDKMAALTIFAKHFKIVGDEGDGVNALASALADRLKAGRRRAFGAPPTHEVEDARIIEPVAIPAASTEVRDEQLW